MGAYFWTLPLANLSDNQAPNLVLKQDSDSPLLFAHKAEALTVLSDDLVLLVHDDDRVLGRDSVEDPETQFSRGANQAAYTLVSLGDMAPETLPQSGGAGSPGYVWVMVLGGLATLSGLGLELAGHRPGKKT